MLTFERVPVGAAWDTPNVFCTPEWVEYLTRTQRAEPVIARIDRDGAPVGMFTGLVVRRFGVRILGSPFQGWMTGPMGFELAPDVSRLDAIQALVRFAFRELGCLHMEVIERGASFAELAPAGGRLDTLHTYELDLRRDEEELFAGFTSACRRAIRKGEREGVRVEEAQGVEFADEYYEQLLEVFGRQGNRPPYSLERVRELVRCMEPTGRLLLLRAVEPGGASIATAIFPFGAGFGYFWGGASWQEHRSLRPNEAIFWHAIRRFREEGVAVLNFGGGGDFKRKFGAPEIEIPILRRSRVPGMLALRDLAADVYKRRAMRAPAPRPQRAAEPFPRATAQGLRPRSAEPAEREQQAPRA